MLYEWLSYEITYERKPVSEHVYLCTLGDAFAHEKYFTKADSFEA